MLIKLSAPEHIKLRIFALLHCSFVSPMLSQIRSHTQYEFCQIMRQIDHGACLMAPDLSFKKDEVEETERILKYPFFETSWFLSRWIIAICALLEYLRVNLREVTPEYTTLDEMIPYNICHNEVRI